MFRTPIFIAFRAILREPSIARQPYFRTRMSSTAAESALMAAVTPENNDQKLNPRKRPPPWKNNPKANKFQRKQKKATAKEGSHEEVLLLDIQKLLKSHSVKDNLSPKESQDREEAESKATAVLPDIHSEVQLTVSELSSTGDALAFDEESNRVYVVPFSIPGDIVRAKVFRHVEKDRYSVTDLVKVIKPSPKRDDSLIRCKYFASCGGCQLQMLPYPEQLAHKRTIVEKAFLNFSELDSKLLPTVGQTIGSPLEYGYRTKLTPHFDGPLGGRRDRRNGVKPVWTEVPPIGFMKKSTRHTLDIEDCPIGTDAVRMGMKLERARVTKEINNYQRGATLLLRESTTRHSDDDPSAKFYARDPTLIREDHGEHVHEKTCVTDSNAKSTEYVDNFIFENSAGSFFQNNNSILPRFTEYIRSHILPPDSPNQSDANESKIRNLVDAYSGSGLFTITLSSLFTKSIGIDVDPKSIASATNNLQLNNIPPERASFMAADANEIFASITFPADETVVVIDPPRKGCDSNFMRQLLKYGPRRVVYVSCNVHTQARDVGVLVRGLEGTGCRYDIESLVGFDFFPQTGHVEGVAILRRGEDVVAESVDLRNERVE